MKIVHIIYDDPKNHWVGGGGALRTAIINELLAAHHEITVITGSFKGAMQYEVINGVHYHRIGIAHTYLLSRISFSLLAGITLRRIPHDILIEDFSGNSPTFAPLFTNTPTIAVLQNFFGANSFRKFFVAGVIPFLYEKLLIQAFDRLITVSNAVLDAWVGTKRTKPVAFIPQGIFLEQYVNIPTAEKYLLFVGRLDFVQKGIDILLESLTHIRNLGIQLVMIGSGNTAKLNSMIKAHNLESLVVHHERVPHAAMIQHYANAYFLCLPSRYEGWPLVCLEAYAAGKPVLGTKIPGLADVVDHGSTGILVPPNDAPAFADAMRLLLTDAPLRKKLGAQAALKCRDYTWEKIAEKQNHFYNKVSNT